MSREELMEFEDVVSDREEIYSNLQSADIFNRAALNQVPVENVADIWAEAEQKTEFYIDFLSDSRVSDDVKSHMDIADVGFRVLNKFYQNAESYLEAEKSFDAFVEGKGRDYRSLSDEMEDRGEEGYDFVENMDEVLGSIEELDQEYWEDWGIEILRDR